MQKQGKAIVSESSKQEQPLEMALFEGEQYFKIVDSDRLRPFFMSIVSDSNHWMFVSSNGGISAGRKNPELALFPYYTEDKIAESADITGSKTIFRIVGDGQQLIWEPFSERYLGQFKIRRNLYKSIYGNKIIFEEENLDLGLVFYYQWNNSKQFGFVRKAGLINKTDHVQQTEMLDGLQNVMPYGVPSDLQRSTSNLVDAYKRTELEPESGIGIFALSAIITDRAEPSEALKANVVWCLGLENPGHLLSSLQLKAFRNYQSITHEFDIKGEKGAYFVHANLKLAPQTSQSWQLIANVNQTQADVVKLKKMILDEKDLLEQLEQDIAFGTENLIRLVGAADGLQATADPLDDSRHFANTLFNIMRGGTFDHNYQIEKQDFAEYLLKANKLVASAGKNFLSQLPEVFDLDMLLALLEKEQDVDLTRLAIEYLPLKFSRRHGDPSRPWNNFSINTQRETDGAKILDYEGNWRDIFQNWEALAHAYPVFIRAMIFKFLNATTFDGYNPYRVTKDGFDWETIEPDNPWSYIGYWGDHQLIYLLKFLELAESYEPGSLKALFSKDLFVYAAVPYIIKPYDEILANPKDTILFDTEWDQQIRKNREEIGADGALIGAGEEELYHVNFIEKILATLLAKLANFIPEAGIWMNTQRPEWNDANNALVGNGVSVVTLNYLYRFMKFFDQLLDKSEVSSFKVSAELTEFYHSVRDAMLDNQHLLGAAISDQERKNLLESFGRSASDYRKQVYENGFWGKKRSISLAGLKRFTGVSLAFLEHSIRANKRPDNLYHAYNLITISNEKAVISRLSEMLEGQVAVLSAGLLSNTEALQVMDALKNSALFRPDQYSYVLYPNKALPGFLEKNNIPADLVKDSALLQALLGNNDRSIIEQDVAGAYHFNAGFRNVGDLKAAIKNLPQPYQSYNETEHAKLYDIWEQVFHHKAFTGRSGTFYGYEGLGSIYWHMVSKLHLAVQECCMKAIDEAADGVVVGRMLEHYYETGAGIGSHKSPDLYGAFPTDPYSHTPLHRGAQQPGMTGQVKEDLLVRLGEMGVRVQEGLFGLRPFLLRQEAFLKTDKTFGFTDVKGMQQQIELRAGQLAFTYCQVPIVYTIADADQLTLVMQDGNTSVFDKLQADHQGSRSLFHRNGVIKRIDVSLNKNQLK